jgi:hypothetical protein
MPPPAGAEAPFLLRLGRHCDVAAFARTADAAPGVAEAQQSRVVELQFFAAAQDATQRGFDSRGVYDAAWRRRADASLEGTATRYLRPHGRDRSLATTTDAIVEHVTEVETGGGAWFSHLQRRSLVRTLVGPTLEVGRLSVRLEARAQPAADWSPTLDPNAAGWRWGWLFGRATPEADTLDAATRARLSALSLDAALAEYLKMLAPGAANPAQWTRFLRDWLRLHPDQLGALLARLRDPGLLKIPGARSGAFHALATADLPEIRDALFALMSDPNAPMDLRQEAMRALAKGGAPTAGLHRRRREDGRLRARRLRPRRRAADAGVRRRSARGRRPGLGRRRGVGAPGRDERHRRRRPRALCHRRRRQHGLRRLRGAAEASAGE